MGFDGVILLDNRLDDGKTKNCIGKFKSLTDFISKFETMDSFGEWSGGEGEGTRESPLTMPWVNYCEDVHNFLRTFYKFSDKNPDYCLTRYSDILVSYNLKWGADSLITADVDLLPAECILAMIMGVIRGDRFSEGALLSFFKNGCMLRWLKRLEELER